ncbi:MAG: cytochrome c [Acidobacteriia bacterium]|nr:cytochrome c [Terriglobia bacterium]
MAEELQDDPIVTKSYTLHYLIASVLLIATLFWALWDEAYGQRPWKRYQEEFRTRYLSLLRQTRSTSGKAEEQVKDDEEYKKLDAVAKAAEASVSGEAKQIQQRINELNEKIAIVQSTFTDARAHVTADTYDAETSSGSSRERKLAALEEYKKQQQFEVNLPEYKGKKLSFNELDALYADLKNQKAAQIGQLAEVTKPAKAAAARRDQYLSDHMSELTPEQIAGLQRKMGDSSLKDSQRFEPEIQQINVASANIVDRCESCHMGVREPVKLTLASMTPKGAKPDEYARAFVGHPRELLSTHDPEKFGCSPCHGGNGRATTSVEKAHGHYEHWLWPLFAKENVQAGCQSCHAADMVLAGDSAEIINEGKDLFRQRGCNGCHRYEGYDKEPEDLQSARQQIKQLEQQNKDNLKQAAIFTKQGDNASDNAEANRLYARAEALKIENSKIFGRIEQLDLQSRNLLRDMKKIGPNLKDVRAKLNKNWIPVWIHKPTEFRPTSKMPNFRLNDEQVKSISAYLWQTAVSDALPQQKPGNAAHGKDLFETRGCMACHSMGEGSELVGGTFAANLTRVGEKANYDYLVRWIHNPRQRTRPYCAYEKKDIGPEDYAKKGLPYVFDEAHSRCPNDGHELQIQNMTVMPILRLSEDDARDIATYLIGQKKKDPSSYANASFMDDPKLKEAGRGWIRHFGCAGCHEISGFEEEGRIGTELTAEGSKPIERLDFALLTHPAEVGGKEPITDAEDLERLPEGPAKGPWYDHKGFFEHKLAEPNIYDQGKIKSETEKLRMPNLHLSKEQVRALTTFLLGSQETSLPASYQYKPEDWRHDVQEGWWIVKKYNCMGCHQFLSGQPSTLMQLPRYQDPDWKEQLPPKLLTEGARVDPEWLLRFLHNPSLSESDTNRNGVRPYLKVRMPTFNFSESELRKLVRFFQAAQQQPMPYIRQQLEALTPKETEMGRSLFSSVAAPCLKCHATGDAAHDQHATAPNFLMAKDRLKPGWTERWIIDPQSISPGTSMPSGLFHRQGEQWVFSGPTPASFQGYDKDHTKLLVRYIFALTAEEQRRVSGMMKSGPAKASSAKPVKPSSSAAGSGR